MLGAFGVLQTFIAKAVKVHNTIIDGIIFRLHYRLTVLFLLGASILLSCNQFFGDPIHCIPSDADDDNTNKVVERFCWIHATYILPHAWNESVGKYGVPHPGIDRSRPGVRKVYHAYYQWVAFVLLFQAIFFYLPRLLWKAWEKGFMRDFGLNLQNPMLDPSDSTVSYKLLSYALRIHWGHFSGYFQRYVFCEFLTLINVLGQMWLLNTFFGGAFMTFGTKVIQWTEWDQEYRRDPFVETFPRMTKCMFHFGGPSGDLQDIDTLCILPLNILNEKIFVFLWFWMVILCFLTCGVLVYRLLLVFKPSMRYSVLALKAPQADKGDVQRLVDSSNISDWFILYLLSKNIDPQHYRAVIRHFAATMGKNGSTSTFIFDK